MRTSELIQKLQEAIEIHGDLEIIREDFDTRHEPINDIVVHKHSVNSIPQIMVVKEFNGY